MDTRLREREARCAMGTESSTSHQSCRKAIGRRSREALQDVELLARFRRPAAEPLKRHGAVPEAIVLAGRCATDQVCPPYGQEQESVKEIRIQEDGLAGRCSPGVPFLLLQCADADGPHRLPRPPWSAKAVDDPCRGGISTELEQTDQIRDIERNFRDSEKTDVAVPTGWRKASETAEAHRARRQNSLGR